MNRALSFVMMRNGTRASYGRKLGNSFFSPFKRVKKESFFTKFEIAFLAEWLITTAHNIIPSMPPGGWENRDGISLIPPRNGVGLEKIRILRSTSGFRGKKWVKSWYKRAKLGKRKMSANDFCVMVIMGLTSGHSKCLIHAFTVIFFKFIPCDYIYSTHRPQIDSTLALADPKTGQNDRQTARKKPYPISRFGLSIDFANPIPLDVKILPL